MVAWTQPDIIEFSLAFPCPSLRFIRLMVGHRPLKPQVQVQFLDKPWGVFVV